jgi:hypothetical protein
MSLFGSLAQAAEVGAVDLTMLLVHLVAGADLEAA